MSAEAESKPPILKPGTLLGDRFEIVQYLGGGGFGSVYRAKQMVGGIRLREVALKLIYVKSVTLTNLTDVFGDAIELIALHESCPSDEVAKRIVRIYDVGCFSQSQPYISMTLVRGGETLASAIRRYGSGGMPVGTALHYLREILIPLAWMHTLDIQAVHADLKPENILVTEQRTCVLTDFGLATRLPIPPHGGTLPYQAPESLLDAEPGTEADVYSVGVLWYEMQTGRSPFKDVGLEAIAAGDIEALKRAHIRARRVPMGAEGPGTGGTERIPLPSETNEEIRDHPQVEAMLARCLTYERSDRYRNARMLLNDLEEYAATGKVDGFVPVAPTTPQTPVGTCVAPAKQKSPNELVADSIALRAQLRFSEALEAIEKALESDIANLAAMVEKARVLARLGRKEEALTAGQTAQKQAPKDPQVTHALADVYEWTGNAALARALRQKAAGGQR